MRNTILVLIIFVSSALIIFANQEAASINLTTVRDSTEIIQSNPDSSLTALTNIDYAKEILKKYILAIGSEELLRNVNDRIIDMKGIVQGVETEIMFYQKAPNKLCQKIITGEVEQNIIFDGTNGIKIIGDTRQVITGNELIKLSFDAIVNLILDPEIYNVKLQYKGLEIIDGRDCYTILLTLPNGAEWIQYYDMETGLKIRDSKDIITPQGNFKQITEYDDYRTIEGIRYPFKITQYLGNQTLDFTIESIQVNTGISDEVFLTE